MVILSTLSLAQHRSVYERSLGSASGTDPRISNQRRAFEIKDGSGKAEDPLSHLVVPDIIELSTIHQILQGSFQAAKGTDILNEDWKAIEYSLNSHSIGSRIRIRAQKILYYLLTGYWSTGERLHPFFVTNNYVNHIRVYQYLKQFAAGKRVLDVGCGVGYGTALLARASESVAGIDISLVAIREAIRLYPYEQFFQMDAENMTFPDESFDVIISTENFEHLPNQARHVDELARVVRKDGFCFIATPNPELFEGLDNPYHTKENTYSELRDLFSRRFREVVIVEPTRIPTSPVGLAAHQERFAKGERGVGVTKDLEIFGRRIDQRYLSNTHSFHCFVRDPIS
jgi:2-polyprenyl-3-methyl-5-hydroxy-6-metoxy-1,4-benzoquinol methylase